MKDEYVYIYPFILYKSNNYKIFSINYEKTIYNCKIICYNCNRIIKEALKLTNKEIYCMGRAEYLAEYKGYTLTEAYAIAEEEWDNDVRTNA